MSFDLLVDPKLGLDPVASKNLLLLPVFQSKDGFNYFISTDPILRRMRNP